MSAHILHIIGPPREFLWEGTVNEWQNNNPNAIQLQAALCRLLAKQSVGSSECGNTLDSETNSGGFSLNPLRKGLISNAEVAIDRELEDILWAHPECESTLSDNILFYIAGYIVRSLSGSVRCDKCINQLIGEPDAGVDHRYTWDCTYSVRVI